MWIFTSRGFISIVRHRDRPEFYQVRPRVAAPLEALWPSHDIEIIEWADYRYRITIERSEVLPVLIDTINSIEYTNFKAACTDDDEYQWALRMVWRVMLEYQARSEVAR